MRHRPHQRAAPKAIERPHDKHIERAAMRVGHHPVEDQPRLRGARLLFILGDDIEAARRDHAFNVGPLVRRVPLALAHAPVNGRPIPHAVGRITTRRASRVVSYGVSTMFSAKVKGGVIVAEDIDLPEGATVTVVLDEDTANDNADDVTPEQLAELDEAIAEADRGESIPWETVRAELFSNR